VGHLIIVHKRVCSGVVLILGPRLTDSLKPPKSSLSENLCVGHNLRLMMEVTKKEEQRESREVNKEVKRPEIRFGDH
jgi:hypothetical protein